jgi:ornithine decarboxylase
MPRVQPFYAVKCNPEPALLKLLAALGAGFDCASKAELEAVLALGVPKDKIIFAHPCKRACDLRFCRDVGVQVTTFDTESELAKVAATCPSIQLVLRVRCDDPEVGWEGRGGNLGMRLIRLPLLSPACTATKVLAPVM